MKAIVLVGGLGTRLRPLTLDTPKPLLPIWNRPFISYLLDMLKKGGVKEVVLAVGWHIPAWRKALKTIAPRGPTVRLAVEKTLLGTGGAIRNGFEMIRKKTSDEEPILVLNGDIFIELDVKAFLSFHKKKGAKGSIAARKVKDASQFGMIQFDSLKRIQSFLEKPGRRIPAFINAGAYILNASVIKVIPRRLISVERDVFPKCLSDDLPLFAYPTKGYWNDIGHPHSYLKAHQDLIERPTLWTDKIILRKRGSRRSLRKTRQDRFSVVLKGRRVQMGRNVALTGIVSIGDRVSIEKGCAIKNSIIMEGCRLAQGVTMDGAILGKRCRIGPGSYLKKGTVIGGNTALASGTRI